jgi:hypothetical protein
LTLKLVFVVATVVAAVAVVTVAATSSSRSPAAPPVATVTFYVRPGGSDSGRGTSWRTAWRTVARVNQARLPPGAQVLFQGGATFTGTTLIPRTSGTSDKPIRFSSFGEGPARIVDGDGAVWLSGVHDLVFDRLWLSAGGAEAPVLAGSEKPSADIQVTRSVILGSQGAGIISPSREDSGWQLTCNTIQDVGDSGIIVVGSDFLISGNVIRHTGFNPRLDYGKHGIYAKGEAPVIRSNVIQGFADSGISLRQPDSRVTDNTISDGPIAIAFHDESTSVGHSYVQDNLGYDITTAGFYFAPDQPSPGQPAAEKFTVSGNRFDLTGDAVGLNVSSAPRDLMSVSDNTTDVSAPTPSELQVATAPAKRGCPPPPDR